MISAGRLRIGEFIPQRKRHRWVAAGAAAAILAIGAGAVQSAPAADPCANQQPCNDDYINSLELNARGTHLNGTDTLKDVRNTAAATVQSDIFNPPKSGGPAEPTSCHGLSYGHTVWYDFYPDRDGTVLIRTAGYDNVITLYR